jgi:hypothetical protein
VEQGWQEACFTPTAGLDEELVCGRPAPPAGSPPAGCPPADSPPAATEPPPSGVQKSENVLERSGTFSKGPGSPKEGGGERVFPKVGLAVTAAAAAAEKVPPSWRRAKLLNVVPSA